MARTDIEQFIANYQDGRIPSTAVQNWFVENKNLPIRTFQWYMQEELIPAPGLIDGRNHFYTRDQVILLADIIAILKIIKTSSASIRFSMLKTILKNHKYSREIVDFLLNMIQNYPIYRYDELGNSEFVSHSNVYVWGKAIAQLEQGEALANMKLTDIEDWVVKNKKIG